MPIRFYLAGALLTLLLTLALGPALAPAAAPPASQPEVITVGPAAYAGVYVFYDYLNLSPTTYPIRGGHVLFPWNGIETGPGVYDWSWPEQWIGSEASRGKVAGLAVNSYDGQCCGGSRVPAYLKQQAPTAVISCSGIEIPRYWDPAYQHAFGAFVTALGQRYDQDSRIAWVELSAGIYGETTPAEGEYNNCLKSAGLTSQVWIETVKWVIDAYVAAFPHKQLLLQYAPFYDDRAERRILSDYAASRGVGLKHNGLKPDPDDAIIDDPNVWYYGAGNYDPIIKWGASVATGWEGYENQNGSMRGRTDSMWSIYSALDKHADYLVLDTALVMAADRQDLLRFADSYLGRTITDTPSVLAALRETQYTWFPEWGNFEFWLYQRDSAPGGKTVPLWNVGTAAEGRFTRRTDQATGNPDMFFDVDDRYIYGASTPVTVTVTYYDKGADAWQLRYDAVDDPDKLAATISKTNSLTWKTATFLLPDTWFANRQPGGSDFHVWSLGDGDEIIHFVAVTRPATVMTVEKVLQPGVDGYAGASDTTLNLWTPDVAAGGDPLMLLRYNQEPVVTTHQAPVLRFDLASVPAGAELLEASLSLYLAEVGREYFVVRAREGDPNVAFAWRLSATRKGYAGARLEEVK